MSDFSNWENRLHSSILNNIDYIVENTPKDGVVYDVGANTGYLSMKVFEKRPDIKLFLFEPVKKYYDSIVEKFKGNSSVNYFNTALLDFDGEIDFSLSSDNLGWNSPALVSQHGEIEKVPCRKLDSVIDTYNLPKPDLIKVDVEQSEFMFVEGAKNLLSTNPPKIILMEIGITPGHRFWDMEEKMIKYLFDVGYAKFDYNQTSTYDAKFLL